MPLKIHCSKPGGQALTGVKLRHLDMLRKAWNALDDLGDLVRLET